MEVIVSPREKRIFEQHAALREQQIAQKEALTGGPALPTIPANRDKSQKIFEKDKDYVHVRVNTRTLNAAGTDFHDEPRVLKLNARAFEQLIKDNGFAQYNDSKVIHDPRPNAPKDVKLVTRELPTIPGVSSDAEIAAREQKLADKEKAFSDKMAQLDAKIEQLGKMQKSTPTKIVPPVQGADKNTSDLPNLDDLDQNKGAGQ